MKHRLTSIFLVATAVILGSCQWTSQAKYEQPDRLHVVKKKLDGVQLKLTKTKNAISVFNDPSSGKPVDLRTFQSLADARKEKGEKLYNQIAEMIEYDNKTTYKPEKMPDFMPCVGMKSQSDVSGLVLMNQLLQSNMLGKIQEEQGKIIQSYNTLTASSTSQPGFLSQLVSLEWDVAAHQRTAEVIIDVTEQNITTRAKLYSDAKDRERLFYQNYGRCADSFERYKYDRKRDSLSIVSRCLDINSG